jgi:hypothetical protein
MSVKTQAGFDRISLKISYSSKYELYFIQFHSIDFPMQFLPNGAESKGYSLASLK